jgi:hypothetical protein
MDNTKPYYEWDYAIKNNSGLYYTGEFHNSMPVFGAKHNAYTFTESGAYTKIVRNPQGFGNCTVERVN